MKKTRLIVALLLAMLMVFTFAVTACDDGGDGDDDPPPGVPNATINSDGSVTYNHDGVTLNMAVGYESNETSISFRTLGSSATVKLPSGTYKNGDLKPAWSELSTRIGVGFDDVISGASNRDNEFTYWNNKSFRGVDVLMGPLSKINEAGRAGKLLNLAEYLDYMPNFKAFMEANPLTYLSILGDFDDGAFYTIPYFDGYDDIERYPMMRVDFVEKLLDGETAFTSTATVIPMKTTVVYDEPFMQTTGQLGIDVANKTGTEKTTIDKDYDAALAHFKTTYPAWYGSGTSGNIVDIVNAYRVSAGATYVGLVNVLREYIDEAYDGYYSNTRSDLFCGVNGAWDADELVALLHCVVGNAYEFNDSGSMAGLFTRDPARNDRRYDLIRLAGQLFGVRGVESRTSYFYFDKDGNIVDARGDDDIYNMALRMNELFREGLIDQGYIASSSTSGANGPQSEGMIQSNKGFMMYDYVQTQTALNVTSDTNVTKLQPVLVPVSMWDDQTSANPVAMRFTESWRSVKTDGSAVNIEIANDPDKLAAVLHMIDYFYTAEGRILMTYGPEEFYDYDVNTAGKYINYNGEKHPKLITAVTDPAGEFYFNRTGADVGGLSVGGSYSAYARKLIGTTLCITNKMQSFEMQLTDANGRAGEEKVATAIGLGLIKHVEVTLPTGTNANWWYTSLPAVVALSEQDDTTISTYKMLAGSTQAFDQANSRYNLFTQLIVVPTANISGNTYTLLTAVPNEFGTTIDVTKISKLFSALPTVTNVDGTGKAGWGGGSFASLQAAGWQRQLAYYNDNIVG